MITEIKAKPEAGYVRITLDNEHEVIMLRKMFDILGGLNDGKSWNLGSTRTWANKKSVYIPYEHKFEEKIDQ